jgi:hypothetical protein
MKARTLALIALGVAVAMFSAVDAASPLASPSAATLARGRALVVYGTCNDCHTAGWRDSDGAIPVTRWPPAARSAFAAGGAPAMLVTSGSIFM